MKFLKKALEKIGTGLAYGVGFGIIMLVYSWANSLYYENKIDKTVYGNSHGDNCRDFKKCEATSGLKLAITKERIDEEEFILLGKLTNSGDIEWTSVSVKAELFDKEGNFIDECTESVNQKVFPDSEVNFKLSCTKCSKVSLDGYASYKAFIIDGNTW